MRKMLVKRTDLEKGYEQGKLNELVGGFVKMSQGTNPEGKNYYKIFKIHGFKEYQENLKPYQFKNQFCKTYV